MPFSLTELTTNCYKAPPNEIVIAPSLGARLARSSPCGGNPAPELIGMTRSGVVGRFEILTGFCAKGRCRLQSC